MKKCINCNKDNHDNDKYCRNCGVKLKGNTYYIIINILTIIVLLLLIGTIMLSIAVYLMY